jgi:hypothetical protein
MAAIRNQSHLRYHFCNELDPERHDANIIHSTARIGSPCSSKLACSWIPFSFYGRHFNQNSAQGTPALDDCGLGIPSDMLFQTSAKAWYHSMDQQRLGRFAQNIQKDNKLGEAETDRAWPAGLAIQNVTEKPRESYTIA